MSIVARFAALLLALNLSIVAEAAGPKVIIAKPQQMELADRAEALGTLRANESVTITASVTETIVGLHFDDGQWVDAGTVLVELNSDEERARLDEVRVRIAEAENQYNRVKSLVDNRSASQSLLDERLRDLDMARAERVAIEARLARRTIKAPFAGVLGLRNLSVGALVTPGEQIVTLDDDRVLKLDFAVPSLYLATLELGQQIETRASAFGDQVLTGIIHSIDSRVDPITRSIQVRALIPNPERRLRPGLLMRVELLRQPRTALVIPEEGLQHLGATHRIMVLDAKDQAQQRQVQIGLRRPGEVEIVSGLEADERVIIHGQDRVRPGQAVQVIGVMDDTTSLAELLGSRR